VKTQQIIKPDSVGPNPESSVSAGRASMPAPIAVPAKRSEAPRMLPSELDDVELDLSEWRMIRWLDLVGWWRHEKRVLQSAGDRADW